MEGASGVLDCIEVSRLDNLIESIRFFNVINNDIGELRRFEEVYEEISLASRSY